MPDKTGIQWTDATWNPVTGCSKVSPGCAHCYAEAVAKRFPEKFTDDGTFRPWSPENAAHNVLLHRDRLDQPLRWKRPRMVFVNSMSDLFHEQIPWRFIAEVFAVMSIADQHVFQVLTKRPGLMQRALTWPMFWLHLNAERLRRGYPVLPGGMSDGWPTGGKVLPNVWLGVSIESRRYLERADVLRATPAAVRFISAEPLLGPLVAPWEFQPNVLDIPAAWALQRAGVRHKTDRCSAIAGGGAFLCDCGAVEDEAKRWWQMGQLNLEQIDWLIVGGESGGGARPMKVDWVTDLIGRAGHAGTAMFVKQLGNVLANELGARGKGGQPLEWPEELRVREMPATTAAEGRNDG